jgi:hypothetical protein
VRAAVAFLALALCSCATVAPKPVETITISERMWYPICAGVCPDFDARIRSDGQIYTHVSLSPQAGMHRLQVTPERAAQFAAIIAQLGAPGRPQPIGPCEHYLPQGDPFNNPESRRSLSKDPAVVIRWSGSAEGQLVRCDTDWAAKETIRKALWRVGLYLDGSPRPECRRPPTDGVSYCDKAALDRADAKLAGSGFL